MQIIYAALWPSLATRFVCSVCSHLLQGRLHVSLLSAAHALMSSAGEHDRNQKFVQSFGVNTKQLSTARATQLQWVQPISMYNCTTGVQAAKLGHTQPARSSIICSQTRHAIELMFAQNPWCQLHRRAMCCLSTMGQHRHAHARPLLPELNDSAALCCMVQSMQPAPGGTWSTENLCDRAAGWSTH